MSRPRRIAAIPGPTMTVRIACLVCAIGLGAAVAAGDAAAAPIVTNAPMAVLMDAGTGDVLFAQRADELMAPTSMSKLMTLELVFEALKKRALKLTDTFHVSPKAWKMSPAKMFTRVDTDIPVQALIQGIIVDSGNDACVTIAEGMAGTEDAFAARMTQRAREIGLTRSNFVNATGLADTGQVMTVREIAMLAHHLMTAYPDYYPYFAQRDFTWEKINQTNRLLSLGMGTIDGLKAGHVPDGDYGAVVSAARDTRRFIVVVNGFGGKTGEKDSVGEAKRLLSAAFREYRMYDLVAENQIVGTAPVFLGQEKEVGLAVDQPIERMMSHDMRAKMKVVLDYVAPLKAPVKAGTKVGTLTVTVPGSAPITVPVMTSAEVPRVGFMGAMTTGLTHLFFGEMGNLPPPSTMRKKHGAKSH
jgi:D-alanyl-D-alanine carboxypeptidase (penicillin-binding protein 5/6)